MNSIRIGAGAAALVLLLGGVAGCGRITGSAIPSCAKIKIADKGDDKPVKLPATVILVDLADNSPDAVERTVRFIRPYLERTTQKGGFVKVVADGGEGGELRTSTCLDGRLFLLHYGNPQRRKKEQEKALTAMTGHLKEFLGSVRVAPRGSATRLLQAADNEIGGIRPQLDIEVGRPTAVLVSNLLGQAAPADCLNVDGQTATPEDAAALVDRCFDTEQLSVPQASVELVGVGEGATTTQQTFMANLMAGALCTRFGDACEGTR